MDRDLTVKSGLDPLSSVAESTGRVLRRWFIAQKSARNDRDEISRAKRLPAIITPAHGREMLAHLSGLVPKFVCFSDRCDVRTSPDKQSRVAPQSICPSSFAAIRQATSLALRYQMSAAQQRRREATNRLERFERDYVKP